MMFLILMTLTGMLIKAVIILGAHMSSKIDRHLAQERAETPHDLKTKFMSPEEFANESFLKKLASTGSN